MALSPSALALFAETVVPHLRGGPAIALGVPEIGATSEQLSTILRRPVHAASYAAMMRSLGFREWATLDVSDYEGCDYVADLNAPLRGLPRFDLVIDNGTIEHCFNVAQAFFNAKALCAVGGIVFHNNPANWFGHGFWNMSPCVYYDFYEANGFEVEVYLRDVAAAKWERVPYKPKVNRILPGTRYVVHAVARRVAEVPDYLPIQRWCVMQHRAGDAPAGEIPSARSARTAYSPSSPRLSLDALERTARTILAELRAEADATPPGSWQRKLRKARTHPAAFVFESVVARRFRVL